MATDFQIKEVKDRLSKYKRKYLKKEFCIFIRYIKGKLQNF